LLGAGVDVGDTGLSLVGGDEGVAFDGDPGVDTVGHGIFGHDLEVARLDEIVKGLGTFLLVDCVGVDGAAHGVEVFAEDRLFGPLDIVGVGRDGNGSEQADDDHDDHQFEQGEALLGMACGAGWSDGYHVEYFVPSRAVLGLLVWTSKTFWPPKESESVSS